MLFIFFLPLNRSLVTFHKRKKWYPLEMNNKMLDLYSLQCSRIESYLNLFFLYFLSLSSSSQCWLNYCKRCWNMLHEINEINLNWSVFRCLQLTGEDSCHFENSSKRILQYQLSSLILIHERILSERKFHQLVLIMANFASCSWENSPTFSSDDQVLSQIWAT